MRDTDKFGSLGAYKTLHIGDDDKFGSLQVYTLCVILISLEV